MKRRNFLTSCVAALAGLLGWKEKSPAFWMKVQKVEPPIILMPPKPRASSYKVIYCGRDAMSQPIFTICPTDWLTSGTEVARGISTNSH